MLRIRGTMWYHRDQKAGSTIVVRRGEEGGMKKAELKRAAKFFEFQQQRECGVESHQMCRGGAGKGVRRRVKQKRQV